MESIELKRFWEQVKEELIGTLPENAHPWIYPLEVSGYDNGTLTLVTGQAMGKNILKRDFGIKMDKILQKISQNNDARIVIIYDETAAKTLKKEAEKFQKKVTEKALKEQAMENLSYMQSSANLNLKYKFENFVVGENSKFAYQSALAVAKKPAEKFNPLFIYGSAGLGKTHLMQAIGHYIVFNNPKLKVKYTKTDDYINDFISSTRKTKDAVENMSKFYKKYTNVDVILIDDIQFLESKGKTMDRMQHTFDSLYNKGKQIVITSDRLPKDIPTLTSALCSRFEMGLMVELQPPNIDTRYEILLNLAKDVEFKIDNNALMYIAENFENNVRELEGAFTRVCAFAEINNCEITLSMVQNVLGCNNKNKKITYTDILKIVSKYYGISQTDITGSSRGQNITLARHLSMYLCREITNNSYVNIAEYYNKKHTTIMFAYEKIKKELKTNKEISIAVREMKQALKLI